MLVCKTIGGRNSSQRFRRPDTKKALVFMIIAFALKLHRNCSVTDSQDREHFSPLEAVHFTISFVKASFIVNMIL